MNKISLARYSEKNKISQDSFIFDKNMPETRSSSKLNRIKKQNKHLKHIISIIQRIKRVTIILKSQF